MHMIDRPFYFDCIRNLIGTRRVKVFSGLRRGGKTSLLRWTATAIRESGVEAARVHRFDRKRLDDGPGDTAASVSAALQDRQVGAVLLDDADGMDGWESLALTLCDRGWDVWVAVSGRYRGDERWEDIPVWPLGWEEFRSAWPSDRAGGFEAFRAWGGMPGLVALDWVPPLATGYLEGLVDSVLLRDVVARIHVRNVPMLLRLTRFLAASVGSVQTASSMVRYLASQGFSVTVDTVQAYVGQLVASGLVHAVARWDAVANRHRDLGAKYYLGDTGLFAALLGRPASPNALLENMVFLELRRRGFVVSVVRGFGRGGEAIDVDFMAERGGQRCFVQVAYVLGGAESVRREVGALAAIRDDAPKWLVSADPSAPALPSGICYGEARGWLAGGWVLRGALGD